MNAGEELSDAQAFTDEAGIEGLPVLLDSDLSHYNGYYVPGQNGYAPFPLQVIVDQDGVITYVARQHDVSAVRAELDRLLED